MGQRFEDDSTELRSRYEIVAGWRQRGLMIGLELVDSRLGVALVAAMAQNGVLAFFARHRPSTVLIRPPLIIQADEVDSVLEALDRSLAFLAAHPEVVDLVPDVGVI